MTRDRIKPPMPCKNTFRRQALSATEIEQDLLQRSRLPEQILNLFFDELYTHIAAHGLENVKAEMFHSIPLFASEKLLEYYKYLKEKGRPILTDYHACMLAGSGCADR